MFSITIGIPIYNRRDLLEYCARSINNLKFSKYEKILAVDDCSSEFDLEFLKSIFPHTAEIIQNPINSGGADFAARNLIKRSLELGTDYILILDSDMIISKNYFEIISKQIHHTDGFLSIFNSKSHITYQNSGELLIKYSVGCAGSVMSREVAEKIIKNVEPGPSFDFRYCEYLRANNIRIFSLKNSAAQHLGFLRGQNSSGVNGDIGALFSDMDYDNIYILIEFLMNELRNERVYNVKKFGLKHIINRRIKKLLNFK